MSKHRPTRPEPAVPPVTTRLILVAPAVPVHEGYEQIRVGDGVAIRLDHGSHGERHDPPRLSTRLHVNGLGAMDEGGALELVRELLTGVAELRRRHATPERPYDEDDVTGRDHDVLLTVEPAP